VFPILLYLQPDRPSDVFPFISMADGIDVLHVLSVIVNLRVLHFITIQIEHVVIQVLGAQSCLLVKSAVRGLYEHPQASRPHVQC
jgi:hypothetical protein